MSGRFYFARRRQSSMKRQRRRLFLEPLEARLPLATIMVTSLADNLDLDGEITLREAIQAANLDTSIDGSVAGDGRDTIEFDAALTSSGPATIDMVLRQYDVNGGLRIRGPGQHLLTIDAQRKSRIFDVSAGGFDVTVEGLTLTNGLSVGSLPIIDAPDAARNGGAIRFLSTGTLTIGESTIHRNEASGYYAHGAGIYSETGAVVISTSTISENRTQFPYADGAGIFSDGGSVTVTSSTVSRNSTFSNDASGGGIYVADGFLNVVNSTISGNGTFGEDSDGGGIVAKDSVVTIRNSTIASNIARGKGGGIAFSASNPNAQTLRLENSILASNASTNGAPEFAVTGSVGNNLRVDFSLIGDNTGSGLTEAHSPDTHGNLIGSSVSPIDPRLGPLQYNGGTTETHALLTDSPAIEAGDPDAVAREGELPETDQRGAPFVRVIDGNDGGRAQVDMGAFEYRAQSKWTVDTLADEEDGDIAAGNISLREALSLANGSPGVADTITFAKSLTSAGAAKINLLLGQLEITDALTIRGPDRELLTIDAQQNSRVFNVPSGDFDMILEGLTLTGGESTAGAAIRFLSTGTLTISNSNVVGNAGGGINAFLGSVNITNSSISDNVSAGTGGGIAIDRGTLTVTNSVISGNSASGRGGGISAGTGTVTIIGSTLTHNSTATSGGEGGAISKLTSGALAIFNSVVSENSTAGDNAGGGGVASLAPVMVNASTISNNVTLNYGSFGGGIFVNGSSVTVSDSTVSGNRTEGDISGGGGIYGATTLINSTVSGNSTIGHWSPGGGIDSSRNSTTISNSTITGNSTAGTSTLNGGGGVSIADFSSISHTTLRISHSILAGNQVFGGQSFGPDFDSDPDDMVIVTHSLIGDRSGTNLSGSVVPDADGNLIGTAVSPLDPLLGALADNGGLTQTHALLFGSPAIDAGDSTAIASQMGTPQFDQRGAPFRRVADGGSGLARIDMGAYELQTVAAPRLVVDVAVDEDDGDYGEGDLSLREAIRLANSYVGHQTITFDATVFGSLQTMDLILGELPITDSVSIIGPGQDLLRIDAAMRSRIFNIAPESSTAEFDVNIEGLRLIGGRTARANQVIESIRETTHSGGAIRFNSSGTLSLIDSTISNSSTEGHFAPGGAIFSQGFVALTRSTISHNSTIGNNAAGGGVYSSNSLVLTDSTLSENSTIGRDATGGGIFSAESADLIRSTISGNSTTGDDADGGGLYSKGSVRLSNSTVVANRTGGGQADGGGIFILGSDENSDLFIDNSIVAGNMVTDTDSNGPDLLADNLAILSVTYSLIGDNSGTGLPEAQAVDANGNLFGTAMNPIDPRLAPLAYNGGVTQTHALRPDSPAIDRGDPAGRSGMNGVPRFDQRGGPFVRVFNSRIDMGAFERQTVPDLGLMVDTTVDENDGDYGAGDLSLREAIGLANGNVNEAGPDHITFASSLASKGPATFRLEFGELTIDDAVALTGLGAGATIIDGQQHSRVFDLTSKAGDVTLEALSVSHGMTIGRDEGGGGIRSRTTGTLTVRNSTISNNSTMGSDAGGGGIFVQQGTMIIDSSTVSGNSTSGDVADGGGVLVKTDAAGPLATTILNSTISGNTTRRYGGGVARFNGATAINYSTITNNTAPNGLGSGIASFADDTTLTAVMSSIISGNVFSDVDFIDNRGNAFRSNGFNLIGTGSASGEFNDTDQTGIVDPKLGPLGDNGSSVQTHALLAGSPAIDAGNPSVASEPNGRPEFDQRNTLFVRVFDGNNDGVARIDIGAFERQTVPNLNLVVDTTTDENDGVYTPGDLSLREAIGLANGSVNEDMPDKIAFASSMSSGGAAIFGLMLGDLRITDSVTITGLGAGTTIIDGQYRSRVFDVIETAGDVTLDSIAVRNGNTSGEFDDGAGIRSRTWGTLTVNSSTLSGNTTSGDWAVGAAISARGGRLVLRNSDVTDNATSGDYAEGGGLSLADNVASLADSSVSRNVTSGRKAVGGGLVAHGGTVTLSNSTVSGNATSGESGDGGGMAAIECQLTINDSMVSDNSISGQDVDGGGAIVSRGGTLTLNHSAVSGNSISHGAGGGILAFDSNLALRSSTISDNSTTALVGDGGGGISVHRGTMTLDESTVSGNTTLGNFASGGGISGVDVSSILTDSTVSGNSTLGSQAQGGGIYSFGGALTLIGTRVATNSTEFCGGGIYSAVSTVQVTTSSVSENVAGAGGGFCAGGGSLAVIKSTVSENSSRGSGGGIVVQEGTLTVASSTVSGNSTSGDTANGGGISVDLELNSDNLATISNTTISGNMTRGSGGGLFVSGGLTIIENSTITGNAAPPGFGSGVGSVGNSFVTRVEVAWSIIAGNTGTDVDFSGPYNAFTSNGFNLIGAGNSVGAFNNSDQANVANPMLGPLADNGGPTLTHALLPGSLAINFGDSERLPNDRLDLDGDGDLQERLPVDQRGFARVADFFSRADSHGLLDVGAFEAELAYDLISLQGGEAIVTNENGTVSVRNNGDTLFQANREDITELTFLSGDGDDTLTLSDLGLHAGEHVDIRFNGQTGYDTLRLDVGYDLDLTQFADPDFQGIEEIDITGMGRNVLKLNAAKVLAVSPSTGVLVVRHDDDDDVNYGVGWTVESPQIIASQFVHAMKQGDATLEVANTTPFRNPFMPLDTNRDGQLSPLDALIIVNRLNATGSGMLVTPTSVAGLTEFFYIDTNGDRAVSPIDVLLIVNSLNNPARNAEGEYVTPAVKRSVVDVPRTASAYTASHRDDAIAQYLSSELSIAPLVAKGRLHHEVAAHVKRATSDTEQEDLVTAIDALFGDVEFDNL